MGASQCRPCLPVFRRASSSTASQRSVLVKNGAARVPDVPKQHILDTSRGPYTTARTVDGSNIFELQMHVDRLLKGGLEIISRQLEEAITEAQVESLTRVKAKLASVSDFKPVVKREINEGLAFLGSHKRSCDDHQVTMVLTWGADSAIPTARGYDLITYIQPMPSFSPMCSVEAHRAVRQNPTVKDVQWIADRKNLEQLQKAGGMDEIVMIDEEGNVTEGLQTNFFAIARDGTVYTAPDGRVLAGTVRKVALAACRSAGMPVVLESPSIADVGKWESCFVCSTSRLIKPIRQLSVADTGDIVMFPMMGSIAHGLEDLVRNAVRQNSESLAE